MNRMWTHQYRWRVGAGAFFVLVLFGFVTRIWPEATELMGLYREFTAAQRTIEEKDKLEHRFEEYSRQKVQIEQRLDELLVELPAADAWTDVLQEIQREVARDGLKTVSVRVSEKIPESHYDSVPIELSFVGGFQQVGRVINRLENAPYILSVKAVSMEAEDGWVLSDNLMTKLTGHLMVQKQKNPDGLADQ